MLRPGGRYLFNVWDTWQHNPFAAITHETVAQFFPGDPPGFYRVPFSYHDADEIRRALAAAAFDPVAVEAVGLQSAIPSAEAFARGLVFGNPLYEEITARGGDAEQIRTAVAEALKARLGAMMPLRAIVVSAVKP